MKRYNQRGIRCIAAHAFEGKGAFALPGDPILAGFESSAESRDEIVGCVRTSENRPPSRSFILSSKAYRLTSRVVNFVTDLMKISLLYGWRRRSGRGARAKGCLGGDFLSLEV